MMATTAYFSSAAVEQHIMSELKGMEPREAIDYLVDQLKRERYTRVDRMCLFATEYGHVMPVASHLFLSLWDARGKVCTYPMLLEKFVTWADYDVSPRNLQSHMKHLRRVVNEKKIPVEIETFYGFGYRLTANDPSWNPPWSKDEDKYAI